MKPRVVLSEMRASGVGLSLLMLFAAGCTADKVLQAANEGPKTAPVAVDAGAPVVAVAAPAMPRVEFGENDFAENDHNRDPFRTYAAVIGPEVKKVAHAQREVILPQFSLDELKLVAIVTGGEYPRAMVVDPGGKGWVIKRGDWVGRPELVHIGGSNGSDYQLNWRVDKVRDGDIVFSREDPAQPGVPPASRVIALRADDGTSPREKL